MKNKRIIFIGFALIVLTAMTFSSCLLQEINDSDKDTSNPTSYNSNEPTAALSDWQLYAEETLPEYIPIEDLMQSSEYGSPQISSDGKKIYYRHITDTSDYIEVLDIATGKIKYVPWPYGVNGIPHFYVTPDSNKVLLFIDDSGDENFGIYLADVKKQETTEIKKAGDFDCMFLGFDESNADECFIGIFDYTVNAFHIYRLNIVNETFKLIISNPGNIVGWDFDSQGRLALVTTIDEKASYHVWLKNDLSNENTVFRKEEWTNIITWDYEDSDSSGIISLDDASENILMIDSSADNLISIVNYNIASGKKTIISQDSQRIYDPYGVWMDAQTREVTGVSYLRDRLEWESLDPSFGTHLDVLTEVSDGELEIVDSSQKDEVWLVSYSYDTKSTDYYIYDAATKKAKFLYASNPVLNQFEYAPMEAISFKSSDGLTIHGYVTFPLNMERKNLPLVIYVHGGPWARDTWGFDRDVQFLANRGYMVLQVNFRGSTGYGKDFMLAGDMEWGGKMHQDILDALNWVVGKEWADPDRVAIMGASYGGYEALVGAAFTPEYFACAIDMFGPSSLITLVDSQPPQWSSYSQNLYRSIGNPDVDEILMKARSPYYKADEISTPLLVIQGGNDIRVTQEQSEQLVDAMTDAGIDVEYILFPNAGHGFSHESQLKTFYEAAERFLAQHIGGRNRINGQ